MLKQNKYSSTYYNIVNRAKSRTLSPGVYIEKHHIIPKSLGGSNDKTNMVKLTAREHFICHLLLIKMVADEVKHKMVYAAWQQSRPSKNKDIKVTSHVYEMLRKQMSITYTGRTRAPFSDEWKANMKAGAKTRPPVIMSEQRIQHCKTIAANRKQTGKDNHFYGKTHSDEFKQKQKILATARFIGVTKNRVSCIYCRKDISINMLGRYHGTNCKLFGEYIRAVPLSDIDVYVKSTTKIIRHNIAFVIIACV